MLNPFAHHGSDLAFYIRVDLQPDVRTSREAFAQWRREISGRAVEIIASEFDISVDNVLLDVDFATGSVWIRVKTTVKTAFFILNAMVVVNTAIEDLPQRWKELERKIGAVVEHVTEGKVTYTESS